MTAPRIRGPARCVAKGCGRPSLDGMFACTEHAARVDDDGQAKPRTRIVEHLRAGDTRGRGGPLRAPEHEDEHGTRTPLDRGVGS